ncbi:hypothetical protein CF640_37800, partial [Burkholderia pseudomallei]
AADAAQVRDDAGPAARSAVLARRRGDRQRAEYVPRAVGVVGPHDGARRTRRAEIAETPMLTLCVKLGTRLEMRLKRRRGGGDAVRAGDPAGGATPGPRRGRASRCGGAGGGRV